MKKIQANPLIESDATGQLVGQGQICALIQNLSFHTGSFSFYTKCTLNIVIVGVNFDLTYQAVIPTKRMAFLGLIFLFIGLNNDKFLVWPGLNGLWNFSQDSASLGIGTTLLENDIQRKDKKSKTCFTSINTMMIKSVTGLLKI